MPVRLRVPGLDVDRPLLGLGVGESGALDTPKRYEDVGWWQDGPRPGAEGGAVMVGHLDSPTGPAVFYGLSSLRAGDEVLVDRKDRSRAAFRVRRVEQFPRDRFPSDRVYRRTGPPGLVLITCGGQYDRAAGRYRDNVVVFADLVRQTGPAADRKTKGKSARQLERDGDGTQA